MRGWTLLSFEALGLPDEALLFVLEELEAGSDPYLIAAAARVLRRYSTPKREFSRFLLRAISNIRYHDDRVSLERYGAYAVGDEGTTAVREALLTLRWLGSRASDVLEDIRRLAFEPGSEDLGELAGEVAATIAATAGQAKVPGPESANCCGWREALGSLRRWGRTARTGAGSLEGVVFQDQSGARIRFPEFFQGAPSVVTFFYTRCENPQKCSLTIAKLARLQQRLLERGLASRIRTAGITYDPGYDLPERLEGYGRNRNVRLDSHHRLLRTEEGSEALRQHLRLGVNFIESLVNRHRIEVYVLDSSGAVAARFERLHWDVEKVLDTAADLLLVTLEEPTRRELGAEAEAPPPPKAPRGGRLWQILGSIASFGAAFYPKCPACWATILSVFGGTCIERIPYSSVLLPLFAVTTVANLAFLWWSCRRQRRMMGFALAALGSFIILVLRLKFELPLAALAGVALTVLGTALSLSNKKAPLSWEKTPKKEEAVSASL
jgi:protein SCO1/2